MNGLCHSECIKVIKQTKICLFLFLFRKVRWRTTMHFTITVQYPSIRATKCSRIENALGITLRNLLTTCDDNEHRAPPIFIKYFTLQLKTHSENSCKRMSKVCQLRPNHQKTKIWISFPGIKTKHRNSKFESPTRKGYIYALALSPFTVNTNCIVHRIHRPHSSTPALQHTFGEYLINECTIKAIPLGLLEWYEYSGMCEYVPYGQFSQNP